MSDLSARLRAIASAHAVLGHELHRSDRQWQQDAAVTLLDAADRLEQLAQMTAERDQFTIIRNSLSLPSLPPDR